MQRSLFVAGLVLLLCGCGPQTGSAGGGGDSDADPAGDPAPTDPPAGDPLPGDSDGPLPGDDDPPAQVYPRACADIYDAELVPRFDLEVSPETWAALLDEYQNWEVRDAAGLPLKPYHPAVFRYGSEVYADAMVRLKGRPEFSWVGPKMQFVVAFNKVYDGGRFHGLRKISLDAPPYDPTLLRDRLAHGLMRELGLAASCVNNAVLYVNGAYYGVFANIEVVDKELLQRNFAEAEGDLFEVGWLLETNEETSNTYRANLFWTAPDVDALARLADLEQMVLEWAAEAVIPHADGFWAGSGNFFTYDHPSRGFLMIPWDMDQSFDSVPADADPVTWRAPWGVEQHPQSLVLADPTWRRRYIAAVAQVVAAYDPVLLRQRAEAWTDQIQPFVETDPHRNFTLSGREWTLDQLFNYFAARSEFLSRWLTTNEPPP